jgi:hypothetical protein
MLRACGASAITTRRIILGTERLERISTPMGVLYAFLAYDQHGTLLSGSFKNAKDVNDTTPRRQKENEDSVNLAIVKFLDDLEGENENL